jgi:hypothetical protein
MVDRHVDPPWPIAAFTARVTASVSVTSNASGVDGAPHDRSFSGHA